ncbi:MAG: tRNA dihydrouridine synthase DusB [Thermodesulfobacteriota bacterium]
MPLPPGLAIGPVRLASPLMLAPLAGYSDLPFRRLCREHGAGLVVSEMISCHGLVRGQRNTMRLLATHPDERPVAFQLFGSDPAVMGAAAAVLSDQPIDLIDINMGCPVRKVVRKGAGAALLKDPALAARIVTAVRVQARWPVTVKIRTGWQKGDEVVALARRLADAGAQAVTVHGRTWAQGFGGQADWQAIARVKAALAVPVIGNGDVRTPEDARRMLEETGCDGVMIGRAALGNPWLFGWQPLPAGLGLRLAVLARHLDLMAIHGEGSGVLHQARSHAGRYLTGLRDASRLRQEIQAAPSLESLRQLLDRWLDLPEDSWAFPRAGRSG